MLQLHRYFKESHSQYMPLISLDLSQLFIQLGHVRSCANELGLMWYRDSPEEYRCIAPGELLCPEVRGWQQEAVV